MEENVVLAPLTTFHIGGPARFLVRAHTLQDVAGAHAFARERRAPMLILGGGSNLLMPDRGFEGVVLKIESRGIAQSPAGQGQAFITAAAGEAWDDVVAHAIAHGLWGIENLSGIPGTLGGAVVQNIGAYGQAICETLAWVEVFDAKTGTLKRLSSLECGFDYRDSIFKRTLGRYVVVRAALRLARVSAPELAYQGLAEALSGTPTLDGIRSAVLSIRARKFPDLAREGSAGSFFKNLILPSQDARLLKNRYPAMPLFSMPETEGTKVPLAWLLDHVLGLNGFSLGPVRLFESQPLVVVARRGAAAADVIALASAVRVRMRESLGIAVEPEVHIIA